MKSQKHILYFILFLKSSWKQENYLELNNNDFQIADEHRDRL